MSYIYPHRESKTLEFKSQLPSFSLLVKTCVAFSGVPIIPQKALREAIMTYRDVYSPRVAKKTDEELILDLISLRGEINVADVISLLNVSRNMATRKLNNLISRNLIKRLGKGPSVRYLAAVDQI